MVQTIDLHAQRLLRASQKRMGSFVLGIGADTGPSLRPAAYEQKARPQATPLSNIFLNRL
jgi:hypothetical protein